MSSAEQPLHPRTSRTCKSSSRPPCASGQPFPSRSRPWYRSASLRPRSFRHRKRKRPLPCPLRFRSAWSSASMYRYAPLSSAEQPLHPRTSQTCKSSSRPLCASGQPFPSRSRPWYRSASLQSRSLRHRRRKRPLPCPLRFRSAWSSASMCSCAYALESCPLTLEYRMMSEHPLTLYRCRRFLYMKRQTGTEPNRAQTQAIFLLFSWLSLLIFFDFIAIRHAANRTPVPKYPCVSVGNVVDVQTSWVA